MYENGLLHLNKLGDQKHLFQVMCILECFVLLPMLHKVKHVINSSDFSGTPVLQKYLLTFVSSCSNTILYLSPREVMMNNFLSTLCIEIPHSFHLCFLALCLGLNSVSLYMPKRQLHSHMN